MNAQRLAAIEAKPSLASAAEIAAIAGDLIQRRKRDHINRAAIEALEDVLEENDLTRCGIRLYITDRVRRVIAEWRAA